jgi:hypothetical protein
VAGNWEGEVREREEPEKRSGVRQLFCRFRPLCRHGGALQGLEGGRGLAVAGMSKTVVTNIEIPSQQTSIVDEDIFHTPPADVQVATPPWEGLTLDCNVASSVAYGAECVAHTHARIHNETRPPVRSFLLSRDVLFNSSSH